jgi:D-sedoheptulose 7-phosphate isomerase
MADSIENIMDSSANLGEFAKGYFDYICKLLNGLDTQGIQRFIEILEQTKEKDNTVFFAGNGGSAATASHMVNDLAFGEREYQTPGIKMLSLSDNTSLISAIANDTGYENIFLRQLQLYYKEGDVLVVISASGNSENLVKAAKWIKSKNGKVVGLLGFDGGKLKELCDVSILVETPKGEYGPVEDVHMILDHMLYTWFWHRVKEV